VFDPQAKVRETISMKTRSARILTPAHHLRAVRLAQGRSLRDVAIPAEMDPGHLSKVERGEKNLSVDSLYRLAKVLGLRDLAKQLAPYVTSETKRKPAA
jgi:transcriptional regulator with XRE-family HTH domain